MKWLFAILGFLLWLVAVRGEEWKLVYPDTTPTIDEMPLLSLGRASQAAGAGLLVGSRDGYVLWNEAHPYLIQLDVPFDIKAISSSSDAMFVGGPSGQISVNADMTSLFPSGTVPDYIEAIAHNWEDRDLPVVKPVRAIRVIDDRVLVLAGTTAWISTDEGKAWLPADQPGPFYDIEAFNGEFYATGPSPTIEYDGNRGNGAALFKSVDCISWTTVWDMADAGYLGSCQLYLLDDGLETSPTDRFPSLQQSDSTRLHVQGDFSDTFLLVHTGTAHLHVSSSDGSTWLDHFSYRDPYSPGPIFGGSSPWNPLGIDDGFLYVCGYENLSANIRYNFELKDNQIKLLKDQTWTTVLTTHAADDSSIITPSRITQWEATTFIPDHQHAYQITATGLKKILLPDFGFVNPKWGALYELNGTYYATFYPDTLDKVYVQSKDLVTWTESDYPEGEIRRHLNGFPRPAVLMLNESLAEDQRLQLYMLNEETWELKFNLPSDTYDVGYVPAQSAYFRTWRGNRIIHVERIAEDGQLSTEASFETPTARDYFTSLTCPDGERLVLYGSTERFAVSNLDGTYQDYDLSDFFGNEGDINSVTFVNGWYYIAGTHCLRTKDFLTYEPVDFPGSGEVITVLAQNTNAYFFSRNAVFSHPLELGYMDSVLRKPGWHHAEWLGWFQIIDEELGDIDHLLLGKCWVKQVNDLEYWIRTEALGWIYMRKDWSPWFWRMEDGHWYWLDQDGWPPRAWDDEDQEWEELKP